MHYVQNSLWKMWDVERGTIRLHSVKNSLWKIRDVERGTTRLHSVQNSLWKIWDVERGTIRLHSVQNSLWKIRDVERGTTRLHSVQNSLWKNLRTCRKTDYVIVTVVRNVQVFHCSFNDMLKLYRIERMQFCYETTVYGKKHSRCIFGHDLSFICSVLIMAHNC